nr:proteinaceous RNase P 2 isoform X1 [Ipomoea batatas]
MEATTSWPEARQTGTNHEPNLPASHSIFKTFVSLHSYEVVVDAGETPEVCPSGGMVYAGPDCCLGLFGGNRMGELASFGHAEIIESGLEGKEHVRGQILLQMGLVATTCSEHWFCVDIDKAETEMCCAVVASLSHFGKGVSDGWKNHSDYEAVGMEQIGLLYQPKLLLRVGFSISPGNQKKDLGHVPLKQGDKKKTTTDNESSRALARITETRLQGLE